MITGSTPLPPHSPPLCHSGGGLNVAARHVLLALYLHHRDLHLPDRQLPAPQAAVLTPEAWADTAPEEIAAYLRITCRRFNTALCRRKGTPYPLSALLYPAHHPHPTQLRPPGGWAPFRDAHLASPDEATAARMGLTDQRAYVRGLEARLRARPLARLLPVAPTGTEGFTRPRHPPGQEDQDRSGARQCARQQGATPQSVPGSSQTAPSHAQTPGAHQKQRTHQRPPPPPYRSTQTLQPSQPPPPAHVHTMPEPPYAQSQGTWHHQHHHHAPVPPNPYLLMPQYYSDPHQLHPHHAPAQPGPTNDPPHTAHITAPHHHVYHHHQPLPPHPPTPGYLSQPAHPQHHHHPVQHHLLPRLHGPTTHGPQYTPMDLWGAAHAHQQHRGLVGAPHHHQQPPHPHPIPGSTIYRQPPITYGPQPHPDAHAATSHPHLGTATSQGPQGPHGAHTQHPHDPQGCPDPGPARHPPLPPPPQTVPPQHHPPPPHARDQATDATHSSPDQPIDVNAPANTQRESPLPRPPQETPSPDP